MSDKKISQLTAATTPLAGTEVLPIVQNGVTKKVSVTNLTTGRAVSATELTLTSGNLVIGTSGNGITTTSNGYLSLTPNGTGYIDYNTTKDGAIGHRFYNFGTGTASLVQLASGSAAATNWVLLDCYADLTGSPVNVFRVLGNGNVLNANNSYGAISDAKVKQNIVEASSQWNDVKKLGKIIKKFSLIADETNKLQIGWIAQEVSEISPGLVYATQDKDQEGNLLGTETLGINYSVAYMKAFKALSEALIRIEALEEKLSQQST